jgi:hypothetical protein
MAEFSWKPSAMPGSGWTRPNPAMVPSPTQPAQIDTAAGAASSNSGHRRASRRVLFTSVVFIDGPHAEHDHEHQS